MRVETIQEANEGAPTLILPDDEGGVTYHLITDEDLASVAKEMAESNGWNDEEQSNLYEAMVNFIDLLGSQ